MKMTVYLHSIFISEKGITDDIFSLNLAKVIFICAIIHISRIKESYGGIVVCLLKFAGMVGVAKAL